MSITFINTRVLVKLSISLFFLIPVTRTQCWTHRLTDFHTSVAGIAVKIYNLKNCLMFVTIQYFAIHKQLLEKFLYKYLFIDFF